MAFKQATAPNGQRSSELLSADNFIPERHIVIETLRHAAPRLGLSATVITTLDAMLSCLAPKRDHHTVFASNATLTFRRNGISDRTIRRHAAVLQDAGLLARRDSPNGKRYTKHNRQAGKALRFGFDLSPLFDRLPEIATQAAEAQVEREQIAYARTKIRATVHQCLTLDPNDPVALDSLRALRRKLTLSDCDKILSALAISDLNAEQDIAKDADETCTLSGSDGHIVRHHHNSTKELIEKDKPRNPEQQNNATKEPEIAIPELLATCPEAAQYSLREIRTVSDVVAHARTLAPMIGITSRSYENAAHRLGPLRAAATVWAILQLNDRIKSVGAYFHAITVGSKSATFSPEKLLRRLAASQDAALPRQNCPRTI